MIILARHGRTNYNESGWNSGRTDRATLNAEGIEHAKDLARALSGRRIDAIYSSPLTRAMDTAKAVAESHGLPIRVDPRIIEMDFGAIDERSNEDPAARECMRRRFEDLEARMPGGESYSDVCRRASDFLGDVVETGQDRVVLVVAHLGVNRAMLSELLKVDLRSLRFVDDDNAVLYEIDVDDGSCQWMHTKTLERGTGIRFRSR